MITPFPLNAASLHTESFAATRMKSSTLDARASANMVSMYVTQSNPSRAAVNTSAVSVGSNQRIWLVGDIQGSGGRGRQFGCRRNGHASLPTKAALRAAELCRGPS